MFISPLKHYIIVQQDSSHSQGNGRELMLLPVQSIHQTFYTHSFIYSSRQTDEENETHGGYVTGPTLSICDLTPLLFLLYLIASQRDFFFFFAFNEVWCHPPQHPVIPHGYQQRALGTDPSPSSKNIWQRRKWWLSTGAKWERIQDPGALSSAIFLWLERMICLS